MKAFFSTLLIFFSVCNMLAQTNNTVCITGKVMDERDLKPIYKGVFIHLKINDSILIKTPVDTNGRYFLFTDHSTLQRNKCYLCAKQEKYTERKEQHDECWGSLYSYEDEYLNSSYKVELIDTIIDTISIEFMLKKILKCGYEFPKFMFNENSIDDYQTNDSTMNKDDLLLVIACLVKKNNLVIELSGHTDYEEKNKEFLSLQRAKLIKAELLKLGVSETCIVAKGYAATRPRIIEKQIKQLITREEKEAARAYNRRVSFVVLRRDGCN